MIRRVGPLPIADAMPLARQIVDGLVAAHEVGVIHRDLKPENVMVTPDGHAYIMDFGIALSAVGGTQSSVFAGTLEYMAPEQGRTAAVDSRVDIYAFGLILYDMLTGRKRLQGHDHGMSELMWRMDHAPDAARTQRPDIPEPLDALITKATQPKADARFKDALELHGALSGLANDGHIRPDTVVAPASLSRRITAVDRRRDGHRRPDARRRRVARATSRRRHRPRRRTDLGDHRELRQPVPAIRSSTVSSNRP